MKKYIFGFILITFQILFADFPNGNDLLRKVDKNLYSETHITTAQMIIHGRRTSKTLKVKTWSQGEDKSFSEYLHPPRDAGTKMLKLGDNLWIYDPNADRQIRISGHMLRESVMGSDLSYEDFMEDQELIKVYDAEVVAQEIFLERDCWIVLLTANVKDVSYQKRKVWIDKERFLPLKEELFGKSDKLLKKTEIQEVFQIGKRWYPKKILFKDMLLKGKGTEIIVDSIEFEEEIPEAKFSKAALRK